MWISVIHDENILAQQIDLLDATSGKVRMEALAKPARVYGQDYALSPDGQRLAVLKTDQVEVYDVPPAPQPAPTVRTGQLVCFAYARRPGRRSSSWRAAIP